MARLAVAFMRRDKLGKGGVTALYEQYPVDLILTSQWDDMDLETILSQYNLSQYFAVEFNESDYAEILGYLSPLGASSRTKKIILARVILETGLTEEQLTTQGEYIPLINGKSWTPLVSYWSAAA